MQPRCYTSLVTQNHCYNETRTRLTARSRSLLTASSLLAYCLIACFFTARLILGSLLLAYRRNLPCQVDLPDWWENILLSRKRLSRLASRRPAMDAVVVIQLSQIIRYLETAYIRFCWIPFLTQRLLAIFVSARACPIISGCLAIDVSVVSRLQYSCF
jgi:hypothetical protein